MCLFFKCVYWIVTFHQLLPQNENSHISDGIIGVTQLIVYFLSKLKKKSRNIKRTRIYIENSCLSTTDYVMALVDLVVWLRDGISRSSSMITWWHLDLVVRLREYNYVMALVDLVVRLRDGISRSSSTILGQVFGRLTSNFRNILIQSFRGRIPQCHCRCMPGHLDPLICRRSRRFRLCWLRGPPLVRRWGPLPSIWRTARCWRRACRVVRTGSRSTLDSHSRMGIQRLACSFITRGSWSSSEHRSRLDCCTVHQRFGWTSLAKNKRWQPPSTYNGTRE